MRHKRHLQSSPSVSAQPMNDRFPCRVGTERPKPIWKYTLVPYGTLNPTSIKTAKRFRPDCVDIHPANPSILVLRVYFGYQGVGPRLGIEGFPSRTAPFLRR